MVPSSFAQEGRRKEGYAKQGDIWDKPRDNNKKRLRGRPGDQYTEFNVHKMGNSSFDF